MSKAGKKVWNFGKEKGTLLHEKECRSSDEKAKGEFNWNTETYAIDIVRERERWIKSRRRYRFTFSSWFMTHWVKYRVSSSKIMQLWVETVFSTSLSHIYTIFMGFWALTILLFSFNNKVYFILLSFQISYFDVFIICIKLFFITYKSESKRIKRRDWVIKNNHLNE